MRAFRVAAVVGILAALLQSASAYSPIWDVDRWDAERLAEAGITVASWKHEKIGENPPLQWVEVTYDPSKLRADQNVLMTLRVTASNGETACACRAEHQKGDASRLTIIFAVREANIGGACVEILAPDLLAAAADHASGNAGFAGYRLGLKRILELSREASANKGIDKPLEARRPANAIMVIAPYRHAGTWVFDDAAVGLHREPFVAGIPEMIDEMVKGIPNAKDGFRLLFSTQPFPGHTHKLVWRRGDKTGNWYYSPQYDKEGWLCPGLFKYFKEAPKEIYVKAEPK